MVRPLPGWGSRGELCSRRIPVPVAPLPVLSLTRCCLQRNATDSVPPPRLSPTAPMPPGCVDRVALGELVFRDAEARKRLNRATHVPILFALIGRIAKQWVLFQSVLVRGRVGSCRSSGAGGSRATSPARGSSDFQLWLGW